MTLSKLLLWATLFFGMNVAGGTGYTQQDIYAGGGGYNSDANSQYDNAFITGPFVAGASYTLTKISLKISQIGSMTGTVQAALYANSHISSSTGAIVVNSAAKTFTRSSGSFITDGFATTDYITTSGFSNGGNNSNFVISSISALVITCSTATGLVTETGTVAAVVADIPGSSIATTSTLPASGVQTTVGSSAPFTDFTGISTSVSSGTKYWVALLVSAGISGGSNQIKWGYYLATSPSSFIRFSANAGSTWTDFSLNGNVFGYKCYSTP